MRWIVWKNLCLSKKDGGLSFKFFEEFNQVLLTKQLWRLNQYPNTLVARVLKRRYFWKTHPFEAKKPYQPSYGWKSICTANSLIDEGSRRIIGKGKDTLVWKDKWIPDTDPRLASCALANPNPQLRVS